MHFRPFRKSMNNHRFWTPFWSHFQAFGINFHNFFGIDFWMLFWMPFFLFLMEDGRRKQVQTRSKPRIRNGPGHSHYAPKVHPRRNLDFSWIVVPFLLIFWWVWLSFWLFLITSVANFYQHLAFKWFASTTSISRCRRSPCNYNRPLERHFLLKCGLLALDPWTTRKLTWTILSHITYITH